MKKLKLNLEDKERLTKEQMKKITGGYGDSGCWLNFDDQPSHWVECDGMDSGSCYNILAAICSNPVSSNCIGVGPCS